MHPNSLLLLAGSLMGLTLNTPAMGAATGGGACGGLASAGSVASFCVPANAVPGATSSVDIPAIGTPKAAEYAHGLRAFPWTYEGTQALRILPANYTAPPPQRTDGPLLGRNFGPGTAVASNRPGIIDLWRYWDTQRMNISHACQLRKGASPRSFTFECTLNDDYTVVGEPSGALDLNKGGQLVARYTPAGGSIRVDVFSQEEENYPSLLVDVAIALRTLQIV